jgi:isoleucyl-tRNA synthetase
VPMDLKSTINLPKTAFPMKANLPQNEPKMLARWEQMGIYERIREARRAPEVHSARRPALHQRPHPPGHGDEQVPQGFHRQVQNHVRLRRALRPRMGLPRPAHRNQGRQELGGKKLQMHPTDVRAECRKYAQKFLDLQRQQFKRIGVFGRFDKPYATMTPQYESVVLDFLFVLRKRIRLQRPARRLLVHARRDGARRSRSRIRNHTSPTVWVKYALLDDPAKSTPRSPAKKVSPSSGPPLPGRCPPRWRWPFIP